MNTGYLEEELLLIEQYALGTLGELQNCSALRLLFPNHGDTELVYYNCWLEYDNQEMYEENY